MWLTVIALPIIVLDNLPRTGAGAVDTVAGSGTGSDAASVITAERQEAAAVAEMAALRVLVTSTTAAPTTLPATTAPAAAPAPTTEPPSTTEPPPPPPPPPTTAPPPTTPPPPPPGAVEDAIREWFGDTEALFQQAMAVAECESGLDPNAVGGGGLYHGLFQIGIGHQGLVESLGYSWSQIYDPYVNSHVARVLYNDAGGWSPWGCQP